MGERHQGYGAHPALYQAVASVLVDVMRELLEGDWTDELERSWTAGLAAVIRVMLHGQHAASMAA